MEMHVELTDGSMQFQQRAKMPDCHITRQCVSKIVCQTKQAAKMLALLPDLPEHFPPCCTPCSPARCKAGIVRRSIIDGYLEAAQQGHHMSHDRAALQMTGNVPGPELPLASPSVANWMLVSLPPGNVSIIAYVRYADSATTSPLGLPAGENPAQLAVSSDVIINALMSSKQHCWISHGKSGSVEAQLHTKCSTALLRALAGCLVWSGVRLSIMGCTEHALPPMWPRQA